MISLAGGAKKTLHPVTGIQNQNYEKGQSPHLQAKRREKADTQEILHTTVSP